MSQTENLQQEIQALVDKTIEVNKAFLNEGAGLLRQFTIPDEQGKSRPVFQKDLLTKAMNAYATLNIRHLKNMMELGLTLTRQAMQPAADKTQDDILMEASFVLNQKVKAGETARFQFVMDNDKSAAVEVQLIHSAYDSGTEDRPAASFKTVFKPAVFQLAPGAEQQVDVQVQVPKKTAAGLYTAKVQVLGFEPAYFTIEIEVL